MSRINLCIKNGLIGPDGNPSPNVIVRSKLTDLILRDFTDKKSLFPDMIKRASIESSFGDDNDPSGLDALDSLPGSFNDVINGTVTDSALLEVFVDINQIPSLVKFLKKLFTLPSKHHRQ